MSRAQITLASKSDRERAVHWITRAPTGTRVVFKESKRSTAQNDKMWSMLTEVATQLEWHGQKLTPDDWKILFLDALSRETRSVQNIDGTGFVDLGRSSSNLSKSEFADLLELITAFGANHGVVFRDQDSISADAVPTRQPDKAAGKFRPHRMPAATNHPESPVGIASGDGGDGADVASSPRLDEAVA